MTKNKKLKINFDLYELLKVQPESDEWEEFFSTLTIDQFLALGDALFDFLQEPRKNINSETFNGLCMFLLDYSKYLMQYAHFQPDMGIKQRKALIEMAEFVMQHYVMVEKFNTNKERVTMGLKAFETWKGYCSKYGYSSPLYDVIKALKQTEKMFKE
jgi:hypothetical protein